MQVAPRARDITAEQALLGAVLVNNDVWRVVAGTVRPEHFAEPFHGQTYEAAAELIAQGKTANPVTLMRMLPMDNGSGLSTPAYLARLAAEATTIISAPDYAETVRDAWALRQIHDIAECSLNQATSLASNPRAVIADMLGALDATRAEIDDQRTRRQTAGECAETAIERIERIRSGTQEVGATTGLHDLDRAIGGLTAGTLVVIAGRPGMGKSAIGSSIVRHTALAGNGAGFFSMEMHDEQIAARILADHVFSSSAPLSFGDIIKGNLTDEQYERTIAGAADLKRIPLEIDLSSSLTVSEIAARTRTLADRMKRQGVRLRAIVIDYLKFVQASDRYRGQRVYEVGEITKGLKALAKDMGICVLLLAQLNRQVESREDKRPGLSDLRESGDIESDADTVMLLFREEYYLRSKQQDPETVDRLLACENKLEIIIAKNRNGPVCSVPVFCDVAANAVRNLSTGY